MTVKVENLKVNFKTLEEFTQFKEYGLQELSMLEELEFSLVEDTAASPFYGIYFGGKLIARMCLYVKDGNFDGAIQDYDKHLEIWKLEVLPQYQFKGYGRMLVDYAKHFNLPIVTKPRVKSQGFWTKMEFQSLSDNSSRLLWIPNSIRTKKIS
jgi:GNAT superfamily N-acetyltransferase